MAKAKKLTIKHIYGEELKKISKVAKNLYPAYVVITYNRKTTKLKSPTLNLIEKIFGSNPESQKLFFASIPDYFNENIELVKRLDTRFINEYFEVFEKFKKPGVQFDVSEFTGRRFENVSYPIGNYIRESLRILMGIFFESKKLQKPAEFASTMNERDIFKFIHALKELNPALFGNLSLDESFLMHFGLLDRLTENQTSPEFFFLLDVYDNEILTSTAQSIKKYFSNKSIDGIKNLIFNDFNRIIEKIFQS